MAEEFQAGICGGNWWIHPSKSVFMGGGSSPCSMGNIITSEMGTTYGSWMTDMVDMKQPRSSCKEFVNVPAETTADSSMVLFQNSQKPLQADSDSGGSSILIDSTLPMMGFGLSSPSSSSDWNQALLLRSRGCGRGESYNSMMQEDMNNSGLNSSQVQKDWSPKSFTSTGEDSSMTSFKPISQDFSLDQQQRLNQVNGPGGNSTATCQGLSTGLISSMGSSSSSSSSSYGYPSSLIQSLFEDDPQPQQQPLFNSRSMNYSSMPRHATNLSDLSPSWPNKLSSFLKSSIPKQQQQLSNGLQFSNNAPFWNATATALNTGFLPSSPSQFILPSFEEKPNAPNLTTKPNNEEVRESGSTVKGSEPATKRPRIETPSPLPTFKVRKEKLGDRITALQQLVSPFGKTDTASVLHEAIEYIKFLHDQVSVLSTPYMKNGNPTQQHHQQVQAVDKMKELEAPKQDLRSRGLCLVPIASTFPVTNETTADFWTPTFGATFR